MDNEKSAIARSLHISLYQTIYALDCLRVSAVFIVHDVRIDIPG